MPIMKRPQLILMASIVSVLLLTAFGGALVAVLASAPTPVLSAHDQQELMLSFDGSTGPTAKVTSDQATAVASMYLGRQDQPVQVLHGQAPRIADEAARSVWIVLYAGGSPEPGAAWGGSPDSVVDYTGVIVDDQTGEVLRGFGVGHVVGGT